MTLNQALNQYYERFGENYPLYIVRTTSDEKEMEKVLQCIRSGEKAKEPSYESGAIY